jgi:hypothetical protein
MSNAKKRKPRKGRFSPDGYKERKRFLLRTTKAERAMLVRIRKRYGLLSDAEAVRYAVICFARRGPGEPVKLSPRNKAGIGIRFSPAERRHVAKIRRLDGYESDTAAIRAAIRHEASLL